MPRNRSALLLALVFGFALLTVVGTVAIASLPDPGKTAIYAFGAPLASAQNRSSGGNASTSSSAIVCPSAGPLILGVHWNCVAILNLTELLVLLAGIGITAYVFKGSDRAELPGESADVPVTTEEEEEYRRDRSLGLPYRPPPPPSAKEEE